MRPKVYLIIKYEKKKKLKSQQVSMKELVPGLKLDVTT